MTFERTECLKSFDGTELFFRCFTPGEGGKSLQGLVVAVHGFGEHSGRYAALAEEVCSRNLAFACFDLRGHGKSGPRRGDAENLHAMILDVIWIINHAKGFLGFSGGDERFFGLFGHSYGGLLLTYAAAILGESCPPVFLSSPCWKPRVVVPAWKKAASRVLPAVAPQLSVPIDIPSSTLSENPENNAAYMADELNLFHISARFGRVFLESMEESMVRQALSSIKAPVTIAAGAIDKLVDTEKTQQLFPCVVSKGSKLTLIEGGGHEIYNEKAPARAQAVQELLAWIDNRGWCQGR